MLVDTKRIKGYGHFVLLDAEQITGYRHLSVSGLRTLLKRDCWIYSSRKFVNLLTCYLDRTVVMSLLYYCMNY